LPAIGNISIQEMTVSYYILLSLFEMPGKCNIYSLLYQYLCEIYQYSSMFIVSLAKQNIA